MKSLPFSVTIRSGSRTLVRAPDYPVFENEIAFLFGESGIGKSILSKAVYGLMDPLETDITINNGAYLAYQNDAFSSEIRQHSFFVFQEPSSHLHPLMKISDQIREGSLKDSKNETAILQYLWQTADNGAVRKIIDIFPKPFRPSGGEKQRVLLAMAFKKISLFQATAPEGARSFFVFDEPTGSLDNRYRDLFLKLLFDHYRKRPFTILVITHDYSIISEILRSHADLKERIHFLELSRRDGADVAVNDFSPQQYLSWLDEPRPSSAAAGEKTPVLETAERFRIFGRELALYSDEARKRPAPLIIRKGEMAYVKAGSGVGKTTLAKIIMGLYRPERFSMNLCGLRVDEKTPESFFHSRIWGKRAGMVFQHADESLDLQATIAETFGGLKTDPPLTPEAVRSCLSDLFEGDITPAFLNRKVAYLSGGQKQRLNLLRSLALRPDLLILDEPLNGLDFDSIRKVLYLLEKKREEGCALLMISHNEEIFDRITDKENVYYLGEA